ncbi:hypothetical protein SISNIDRAFT_436663 [Sistotremastrum niveocremeum HHB9708]|uniref:Gfd2/YDR514C-like C-terminal domain-containing protein n=1 Tax=Sistotremastrum niveocremeum HHB9708 TaxID=1314777 RepID=A0A164ZQA0_9AGAM|nr:hypothetical protein SISNIDRAFT_436663 [Sistotremastrum niveocremeum HHB9708]
MTFHPVIHGFYRYTDIIFVWHTAFQDRPIIETALKAFISPHCVTRKDHPFNKDGKGVEFWMGTLPNGEQRLLYSSAQVEYARYWLKEMGFTNGELIPIPDSSYLLRPGSELQAISPVYFDTYEKLKDAQKDVEKNNKRLKRSHNAYTGRIQFERIRNSWNEKIGTWCAIDFEWWEMYHTDLTEVGLSSVTFENGLEIATNRHLIFKENRLCRNGKYSPDNRDHFLFGQSQTLPQKQIAEELKSYLQTASEKGPVFLIFHDQKGDIKCLRETGVELDGLSGDLPEIAPSSGLFSIDTGSGRDRAIHRAATGRRLLVR